MKKKCLMLLAVSLSAMVSFGQFPKASLTASGLTCSMCSKAVKVALEKVPFVNEVKVNIKDQEYILVFKDGQDVDFDALKKAVEDAGFSVASLKVTANFNDFKIEKDKHVQLGGKYFHFLNGNAQALNGETEIHIVDKDFVTEKQFRKYSATTKLECIKTGKTSSCCEKDGVSADSRVYHVTI